MALYLMEKPVSSAQSSSLIKQLAYNKYGGLGASSGSSVAKSSAAKAAALSALSSNAGMNTGTKTGNTSGTVVSSTNNAKSASDSTGSLPSNLVDLLSQLQSQSAANSKALADAYNHQNQVAMDFNAAEAAKNRSWQEYMSNTAHQREIADLKAAGLNPVLSAMGGNGAAVTSGATAGALSGGSAGFDVDSSFSTGLVGLLGTLVSAEASMHNANVSAAATLGAANAAAGAARYGSDNSYKASTYATDKNVEVQNALINSSYIREGASDITKLLGDAVSYAGMTALAAARSRR